MYPSFQKIKIEIYDQLDFNIQCLISEPESQEYEACRFEMNEKKIVFRKAKVTPTKTGLFVTFWKRNSDGIIEPLHEKDAFDFYVIHVENKGRSGQFVFPKAILSRKAFISTNKKEGKRGFRVYPIWDEMTSKQAERTQKWQLNYFFENTRTMDLEKVRELYQPI